MANTPRYTLLKQLLTTKIVEQHLRAGERLPSQNELMKLYGLSFATVTRALNELEAEGMIAREQGRGTFVKTLPEANAPLSCIPRRVVALMPNASHGVADLGFAKLCETLKTRLPRNYELETAAFPQQPVLLERHLFLQDVYDAMVFVHPPRAYQDAVVKLGRVFRSLVVGQAIEAEDMSFVCTDRRQAAQEAVTYLLEQGHRTIGMLAHPPEQPESLQEIKGYRTALHHWGIELDEALVVHVDAREQDGHAGLLRLMDRNPWQKISAVFAPGELPAIGALSAAQAMGKAIPEELSLISLGEVQTGQGPLSAVHVPLGDLAGEAAQALVLLVEGRRKIVRHELKAQLTPGQSVAFAP